MNVIEFLNYRVMKIREFKEQYPEDSEVYYHGETGFITEYYGDSAIVFFEGTGLSEDIDIEELIEQNF